jgi:hypothetical protein
MLTYKLDNLEDIPGEYYAEELSRLGFVERNLEKVDYHIYLDWRKKDHDTKCFLKNKIDNISRVTNKYHLRSTLGRDYFPYLAKEYGFRQILRGGRVSVDGPLIVKPSGGAFFSGKGIEVVVKGDKLNSSTAVICEYVTDVQTFHDKKFHLRVLLFLSTWGKWEVVPIYKIVTAKLPYVKDDWKNKDIHDSHWKSTDGDYFFCEDGDLYSEEVNSQIIEVCRGVSESVSPKPYSESEKAYEMLGLDFLVRENGTVVLLEVNSWAGTCSPPGVPSEPLERYKRKIVEVEMEFVKDAFGL